MAFRRFANALVARPALKPDGWAQVRTAAKVTAEPSRSLVAQASEILGHDFDPERYLLTHCFPAGHQVLMGDGTEKAIEDVMVGDLVVTHAGNIRPVTRLLRREVQEELVHIRSSSLGEVACTREHPFYVIRQGDAWCRVYPSYHEQVKCTFGGKQVCERHSCTTNGATPKWVDAGDIQVGDRTYTPTLHRVEVPSDLNPNRMRLLGYYVAEGRVDYDAQGRLHSIRFAIHEDEESTLGAEIATLMRLEFGVGSHSVIRNDSHGIILSFCSHEHAPWFLNHAGCGSHVKRLSAAVMWAPVHWQRRFMGAWINGDGHYDGVHAGGGNGIRLATSSDDLSSQAMVLLDRMEIHCRRQRVQTPDRQYRGRLVKGFNGWHVEVPASYAHRLNDEVVWDVRPLTGKRLSTKGRYRYAASTLSTVEQVDHRPFEGTVYNLSVADDESYVVNRQAVHNCTIVASVDVVEVKGARLGRVAEDGRKINRKWSDYRVTSETDPYINNNYDCFSRAVLAASYRTFIGAQNFLEHVQIPELSKGRILDAVPRDIGDSVYIDILVATDRKHESLIRDIQSGELNGLSMGCTVVETICTKCGNVAVDETELCDCVRYAKGNIFFDERGQRHRIAELCGHPTITDPQGGVTFIEASWVSQPAFTGAQMRNIIEPAQLNSRSARKVREMLAQPPKEWVGTDSQRVKAARLGFEFDDGGEEPEQSEEPPKSDLDEVEDALTEHMLDRVRKRVRDEMSKKDQEDALAPSTAPNDSVIKHGMAKAARRAYVSAVETLAATATSDAHLMNSVAVLDKKFGLEVGVDLYRSVLRAGAPSRYTSLAKYVCACESHLGRNLRPGDARAFLRLGKILSLAELAPHASPARSTQ